MPTFTVRLFPGPTSGYLTAACAAASIIIETENRAALMTRVHAIVPKMYELCGYGTADDHFHFYY
jgi:lipoprotein